jgi:uncharacterized protein (TIGR02284 family)
MRRSALRDSSSTHRTGPPDREAHFNTWAGASDFRDFSGLLGEKENRIGIAQTLPLLISIYITAIGRNLMATETTTHSTRSNEIERALRSVIQSLIDGQEGFQKIGEHLKEEALRRYFAAESLKRAEFRGAIEGVLHRDGVHDVKEKGTVEGTVERTWADLKAHLGGGDHTLLATAEELEDSAVESYEQALSEDLPLPIKQMLTSQYAHIEASHDYVKAARDSRK